MVAALGLVTAACAGGGGRGTTTGSPSTTDGRDREVAADEGGEPSGRDTIDTTEQAVSNPAVSSSAAVSSNPVAVDDGLASSVIDWWASWAAADAVDGSGSRPADGERVARIPNRAAGPSSVGSAGDLSHGDNPPVFRHQAIGVPSIEFTFEGDTLLQTNNGNPWSGAMVLPAERDGLTLAWVGVITDVIRTM